MNGREFILLFSAIFVTVQVKGHITDIKTSPSIKKCPQPVDLVLLLDSSGSLGLENWRKELDFASNFLGGFDIAAKQSHVGIIDFSMIAKKHFELTDPRQDAKYINEVLNDLKDESRYQNGMTMTDLGLIEATEMFNRAKQNTSRSVPQILIVLTDGQTTWRDGQKGIDLIMPHTQTLRSRGIKTFAIAIGNSIDERELQLIAGGPARVEKHENFDKLMENVGDISMKACPVAECPINFRKVGCFRDNQTTPRPLDTYTLNARDPTHPTYVGFMVDWNNYDKFLKDFVCSCAKAANLSQKGYFGIQFYSECWTSRAKTYDRDGESEIGGCVNTSFRPCGTDDQVCTGISHRNYVYEVEEEPTPQG